MYRHTRTVEIKNKWSPALKFLSRESWERGPGAGERRQDESGADISGIFAVFLSFGWWPLLGFGFPLVEVQAAWTAALAPRLQRPEPAVFGSNGPESHPDARHPTCGGGRRGGQLAY